MSIAIEVMAESDEEAMKQAELIFWARYNDIDCIPEPDISIDAITDGDEE
jgi:hypothetical protein